MGRHRSNWHGASVNFRDRWPIGSRTSPHPRFAAIIAAGILLFFIAVGELVLNAMGVPLLAFQISGGIILFLFALTMIFGESKPKEEEKDIQYFPVA